MVMLIQESSICTPGTGKGRILLGNLFQVIEFAPAMRTRLQSLMIFMKTCWESVQLESTINLADLGINAQDMSELDLPFTEDEVWRTIQQLPSDKAPGRTGTRVVSTNHVGLL